MLLLFFVVDVVVVDCSLSVGVGVIVVIVVYWPIMSIVKMF